MNLQIGSENKTQKLLGLVNETYTFDMSPILFLNALNRLNSHRTDLGYRRGRHATYNIHHE